MKKTRKRKIKKEGTNFHTFVEMWDDLREKKSPDEENQKNAVDRLIKFL